MGNGDSLSVVIPSWREGSRLVEAVRAARTVFGDAELLVVACEEPGDVRRRVRAAGAAWIDAPRASRGLQLQLGGERARGQDLVFLHADTRLPEDARRGIRDALAIDGVAGGAFRLRFDRDHPVLDALAWMSRSTLPIAFLGDQCLFCTRRAYVAAGGFGPEPLFEDVSFARRLARVGRLVRLRQVATTSARRFAGHGPLRQLSRNALLLLAYRLGASPERLAALYRRSAASTPEIASPTPRSTAAQQASSSATSGAGSRSTFHGR